MLTIHFNRINTVKEIISCLEAQIESELNDDFFGVNEELVHSLKEKVKSKMIDCEKLIQELEVYKQQAA